MEQDAGQSTPTYPFLYTDGRREYTVHFTQNQLQALRTLEDLKNDFLQTSADIPSTGIPLGPQVLIDPFAMNFVKQALELKEPTSEIYRSFIQEKIVSKVKDPTVLNETLESILKVATYLDFMPLVEALEAVSKTNQEEPILKEVDTTDILEERTAPSLIVIDGGITLQISTALYEASPVLKQMNQDTQEEGEALKLPLIDGLDFTPLVFDLLNDLANRLRSLSLNDRTTLNQLAKTYSSPVTLTLELLSKAANIAYFLGAEVIEYEILCLIFHLVRVDPLGEIAEQDFSLFFDQFSYLEQNLKPKVFEKLIAIIMPAAQQVEWHFKQMVLRQRKMAQFAYQPFVSFSPFAISKDGKYALVNNKLLDGALLSRGLIKEIRKFTIDPARVKSVAFHPLNSSLVAIAWNKYKDHKTRTGLENFISLANVSTGQEKVVSLTLPFTFDAEYKIAFPRRIEFVPFTNYLVLQYRYPEYHGYKAFMKDIWDFFTLSEENLQITHLSTLIEPAFDYNLFSPDGKLMGGIESRTYMQNIVLRDINARYVDKKITPFKLNIYQEEKEKVYKNFTTFSYRGRYAVDVYEHDRAYTQNKRQNLIAYGFGKEIKIFSTELFFEQLSKDNYSFESKTTPAVAEWEDTIFIASMSFAFDDTYLITAGYSTIKNTSYLHFWNVENIVAPRLEARIELPDFMVDKISVSPAYNYFLMSGDEIVETHEDKIGRRDRARTSKNRFVLSLNYSVPSSLEETLFNWVLYNYKKAGRPIKLFEKNLVSGSAVTSGIERLFGWFSTAKKQKLPTFSKIEAFESLLLKSSTETKALALKLVANPTEVLEALKNASKTGDDIKPQ